MGNPLPSHLAQHIDREGLSEIRPQPAATDTTREVAFDRGTGRPPFTAVLWDLDGTIVDSAPGIMHGITKMLETFGLPVPPYERLLTYIGPPIFDAFRDNGLDDAVELELALQTYRDFYEHGGEFDSRVYPGVASIIRDLRAAGVPQSTATSKPEPSAARVLEHFGIAEELDAIVGATVDESRSKKADVVAEALRVLGEQGADLSNVIMIGDRFYDVQGSAEHGVPCIYVTWGYGTSGEDEGCVGVASTANDLRRLLGLPEHPLAGVVSAHTECPPTVHDHR